MTLPLIVFNVRNGLVTYIVDVNDGVYHINHNDIVTTSDVYFTENSNNSNNNSYNKRRTIIKILKRFSYSIRLNSNKTKYIRYYYKYRI